MTVTDSIAETLGVTDMWTDRGGVQWFATGNLNLRDVARLMNECCARFVTITATQLTGDQGLCLDYLWDLDGKLLAFPFYPPGKSVDSIYDLCEAADWIEREIHEGFAADFIGRTYEPLLLREGNQLGVNLREEAP